MQQNTRTEIPKITSGNRRTAPPDEVKTIIRQSHGGVRNIHRQ